MSAEDRAGTHPLAERLGFVLAAAAIVPGGALRLTGTHFSDPIDALLYGGAIVGAAFVLSWAAEVAQLDISAGGMLAIDEKLTGEAQTKILDNARPSMALYVGGMGHKTKNFHNDIMVRRGFGDAAKRIQELYLAKRKDEAIAAVPDEWVDLKSLVGPPARIRERFRAWEDSGADSLSVRSRQPEAIEVMAQAARLN